MEPLTDIEMDSKWVEQLVRAMVYTLVVLKVVPVVADSVEW